MMHMQCFSKRLHSVTPRVLQEEPTIAWSWRYQDCSSPASSIFLSSPKGSYYLVAGRF